MKIAFDTNALIQLFRFGAGPAPTRSNEWMGAIHNARELDDVLVIPTPALTEFFGCKHVTEDECHAMAETLREMFSFAPFTDRTAEILAKSWRVKHPNATVSGRLERNQIKFDQLVMAIAIENRATHLVTDDDKFRKDIVAGGYPLVVWSLDDLADHYKGPQADLFSVQHAAPTSRPAKGKKSDK